MFVIRITVFLSVAGAMLACSSSEPSEDGPEPRPELVYAEQDRTTSLWSIRGYTDGSGSREIVPGPKNLPRAAFGWMIMRPTTGELLYVAEDPGNGRYILLNPISGEFSRLAFPGDVESWSPTGDLLTIFTVNGVQVVTLDGTIQGTICSGPVICGSLEWTPAGDAVVVARREVGEPYDLWRVQVNGGAEVNLTRTEAASELEASHSPDGQYLAYSGENDLWVAGADGTDPRLLLAPARQGILPWSPDGSSIAVYGSVGGQSGLVVVPLSGQPSLISPGEVLGEPSEIDWSPEGNRLAYAAYDPAESSVPGVFLIERDGTGRRLLSTPENGAGWAFWLPPQP